jgi:Flp pilus assembly protein TadD
MVDDRAAEKASGLRRREAGRPGFRGAVLALAIIAAFANGWRGALVMDDIESIRDNATIRSVPAALFPPAHLTVGGRPLVNVSLAANRWFGDSPASFHVGNIVIHVAAALCLFGVVRRTLRQPALGNRLSARADAIAWSAALLWGLHPLQTAAVTYLVQRAESLMALCYLATLYCFIRATDPGEGRGGFRWLVAGAVACAAGMACKEVMVSAPLIVLLYDRTFVAGTFRAAWRMRWRFYLALAASWVLLAVLVFSTRGRGGTAGLGATVTVASYALTQFVAIVHYVRLALWPTPLVFDYGTRLVTAAAQVALPAALVAVAVAATLVALWRRPAIGFAGACFFAVLAPSSSVVPIVTQTMAEHRVYLALAAPMTLAVIASWVVLGKRTNQALVVLAVAAGFLTARRNLDYRTEEGVWRDTATKMPSNQRAHSNLGVIAFEHGRAEEAVRHFEVARRLAPDDAELQASLGAALVAAGRMPEAIRELTAAVARRPELVKGRHNLAVALEKTGRGAEAIPHYEAVLELEPAHADVCNRLGALLLQAGRIEEAEARLRAALTLDPRLAAAHLNLGTALAARGRTDEAMAEYEAAIALQPDYPLARAALQQLRERRNGGR